MTNPNQTVASTPRSPRRNWAFALLLAAPLLGGGAALAQPPHGFGRGPGEMHERMQGHMQKVLDEVGATAQQKAQIKAVWDQAKPQLQALHQQHRQLHEQMQAALAAPTIDAANVERLRREGVQLMDRQSAITTQAFVSSAQVLSPDQRKQVAEKMAKHGPRFAPDHAE